MTHSLKIILYIYLFTILLTTNEAQHFISFFLFGNIFFLIYDQCGLTIGNITCLSINTRWGGVRSLHLPLTFAFQYKVGPNVNVGVHLYEIPQGDNLTIPCDYQAFPPPTSIIWLKNSVALSLPSADGRFSGGNISDPALRITAIQRSDTAFYECQVTSQVGMGSTSNIRVDVLCELYTICLLGCFL